MRKVRTWVLVGALLAAPAMAQVALRTAPGVAPQVQQQAAPQLAVDYEAQYRQLLERNKALKGENGSLKAQLASFTSHGGSRVTAYCETPERSVNTAGASNDCSATGFGCEPVSGLCRTVAHASSECAAGYIYCSLRSDCVRSARECGGD